MTTIRELPVNGRLELDDRRRRVNGHPRPAAIDGMLDASSALVNLRLSTRSDGTGLAARGLAHGGFEFIGPKPERLSIRTAIRALVGDDSRSDERACTLRLGSDHSWNARMSVDSGVRIGSGDLARGTVQSWTRMAVERGGYCAFPRLPTSQPSTTFAPPSGA